MRTLLKLFLLSVLALKPLTTNAVVIGSVQLPPGPAVNDTVFDVYSTHVILGGTNETFEILVSNTHANWFRIMLSEEDGITNFYYQSTITNGFDFITYRADRVAESYSYETEILSGEFNDPFVYTNKNGYLSMSAEFQNFEVLSNGTAIITGTSSGISANVSVRGKNGTTEPLIYTESFNDHGYKAGSYKKATNDEFNALIEGRSGSDADLSLFSTKDHSGELYVRNNESWAYQIDLSCFAVWDSSAEHTRAGTAITPKHVIQGWHWHNSVGQTIRFVSMGNQYYERTVSAVTQVFVSGQPADVAVIQLASVLPSSITPAKRMPTDWADYIPTSPTGSFTDRYNYPLLITDQYHRAKLMESKNDTFSFFQESYLRNSFAPEGNPPVFFSETERFHPFFRSIKSGDSSSPVFVKINDDLILTTVMTSEISGYPLVNCVNEIQDIITSGFSDSEV